MHRHVDTVHQYNPSTPLEMDSCQNAVDMGVHSRIKLMPNHHIDREGDLHGFYFSCMDSDPANVMPVGKTMCSTISMYECRAPTEKTSFNPHALKIVNDLAHYTTLLEEYVEGIRADELEPAKFDCIADVETGKRDADPQNPLFDVSFHRQVDQREWKNEIPSKIGIYHTFTRSNTKDEREHKVYIIISGYLQHAAEQFYNMWQDAADMATCRQIVDCEELQWLRDTTHRNHNRIASDVCRLFELDMVHVLDTDDCSLSRTMVYPTSSTSKNDMGREHTTGSRVVRVVDGGCFSDLGTNGIIFEMYSSEGFWLFQGPQDLSDYNCYGSEFANTDHVPCFPTQTVCYHSRFANAPGQNNTVRVKKTCTESIKHACVPEQTGDECETNEFMFPDERFFKILESLGFNRNDGVLSLMPLVCYVTDECVTSQ